MSATRSVVILGSNARYLISFRGPLIERLVRDGVKVVCCVPPCGEQEREGIARLGAEHRPLKFKPTSFNVLADLPAWIELRRVLRREQPQAFLAYTIKAVVFGGFIARLSRVPVRVAMIEGLGYAFGGASWGRRLLSRAIAALYRLALRGARAVIFLNPDDRALFESLQLVQPRQSLLLNGIGVDLAHYAAQPVEPGPPSFLLIARLLTDKGIREYADAAEAVHRENPSVRFRLAGGLDDNPASLSRTELDAIVGRGIVEYLGELADVRPALAACAVYVLPSYREGLPRTVQEAMAVGRAIITTDVPGCRETVIEGRNGFIVPPRDAAALAEAMTMFVRTPSLASRMGGESRRLAEQRYDVLRANEVLLRALAVGEPGK